LGRLKGLPEGKGREHEQGRKNMVADVVDKVRGSCPEELSVDRAFFEKVDVAKTAKEKRPQGKIEGYSREISVG